jgi:hypothetical protein
MQLYEQALVTRNYAQALWRTVVLGCIKPENWRYCWPPDWFIPYVQDAIDFYKVEPYANEKAILNAKDH